VNLKDTFPASGERPPDERGLAPRSLHYAQEQAKLMHHGENIQGRRSRELAGGTVAMELE